MEATILIFNLYGLAFVSRACGTDKRTPEYSVFY